MVILVMTTMTTRSLGAIIATQLSAMHSIAMDHIPICYLPIHCVWFVVFISLSLCLSVLSVYRVQCIESDDGRRHQVDIQRGPGDVPMDRLAHPFGSTLDFEFNGGKLIKNECGGC